MIYDFATQLAQGQEYEQKLDAIFAAEFDINPVGMDKQREGIDRHFVRKSDGKEFWVEYKADSRAGKTGNAFVETVSVDTTKKPGWAISSKADVLIYLVVEPECIYCVRFKRLREKLDGWQKAYREVPSMNQGYRTLGLLVPLDEFERIADQVR